MTVSAGLVVRRDDGDVLLVHPGGPFWANKDTHGWSIPKGEYDPDHEDGLAAAEREFAEELGLAPPAGPRTPIPEFRAGRKLIRSWLVHGALDLAGFESNTFEMEWPPRSGRMQAFPEVDRAEWFPLDVCRTKLHKGQVPLCDLIEAVS